MFDHRIELVARGLVCAAHGERTRERNARRGALRIFGQQIEKHAIGVVELAREVIRHATVRPDRGEQRVHLLRRVEMPERFFEFAAVRCGCAKEHVHCRQARRELARFEEERACGRKIIFVVNLVGGEVDVRARLQWVNLQRALRSGAADLKCNVRRDLFIHRQIAHRRRERSMRHCEIWRGGDCGFEQCARLQMSVRRTERAGATRLHKRVRRLARHTREAFALQRGAVFTRQQISQRTHAIVAHLSTRAVDELGVTFVRQTRVTLTSHHVAVRRREQHRMHMLFVVHAHDARGKHRLRIHASRGVKRLVVRHRTRRARTEHGQLQERLQLANRGFEQQGRERVVSTLADEWQH